MGFMKLLEAVVKTAIVLPVAIVKDSCTLGGVAIDQPSAIVKTLEDIKKDIDEIAD